MRIYYQEAGKPLKKQFKKTLELLTESNDLNYIAYLLADENNISIKVAKYKGEDRTEIIENNEFGYCSLIKATKNVLDKINVENTVVATITLKERIELRLWNEIALREAIINAIIHNDYSNEIPPKFEIFSNRIEITSSGSLPERLAKKEFFEGVSVPRNKELMCVYKDLNLVEHLGSGIPRILKFYGKDSFIFSENFTRIVFPINEKAISILNKKLTDQVTDQVTAKIKRLISLIEGEKSRVQLMKSLNIIHREYFRTEYLNKAIELGLIEPTIPNKPTSSKQKYRLTKKGIRLKKYLNIMWKEHK